MHIETTWLQYCLALAIVISGRCAGCLGKCDTGLTDLVSLGVDRLDTVGIELCHTFQVLLMPPLFLAADLQLIENEWNGDDRRLFPLSGWSWITDRKR